MPNDSTPAGALRAAIVVPCYNEEKRLPVADFEAFMAARPEYAWCFVDDGSADGTRQLLEGLCRPYPGRAHVHAMAQNAGKAAAVRAGILHALDAWPVPWTAFWDADLATPLDEIPRFERGLAEHPAWRVLCGSRWLHMGGDIERHVWRHYIGRVFATVASNLLRLPIYDTQCGAKFIEAGLARTVFAEPFRSRWVFDVEMLARVVQHLGHAEALEGIGEIPLTVWIDRGGSKVRMHHAFRIPLDFWRIYRLYLA